MTRSSLVTSHKESSGKARGFGFVVFSSSDVVDGCVGMHKIDNKVVSDPLLRGSVLSPCPPTKSGRFTRI